MVKSWNRISTVSINNQFTHILNLFDIVDFHKKNWIRQRKILLCIKKINRYKKWTLENSKVFCYQIK